MGRGYCSVGWVAASAWESSGQIACQSSGLKSCRLTSPAVKVSIFGQYSMGTPRLFQLPTAAAVTPKFFANKPRPPMTRAAVSMGFSPFILVTFMVRMTDFNMNRVSRSTPRVDTNCVQCTTMKTIGERIQQARLAKRWSADELSKKVGYKTQSGISNLENKATGTGGNKIGEIARVLSVSVDWLMNGPDCENVPFLSQSIDLPAIKQAESWVNQPTSGLYPVQKVSAWPFELFDYADWMLLDAKDRQQHENTIAGAILRAKKTSAIM